MPLPGAAGAGWGGRETEASQIRARGGAVCLPS